MARKIVKSQLIEVIIPAGSTNQKFQLPDVPDLRNVHLLGIETYSNSEVPKSILSDNTVASASLISSIFLTLQLYNGKNFMWQKPLWCFHNLAAATIWTWFPNVFTGQRLNFPKCYLEIQDTSLIPPAEDTSVLLDIYYSESPVREQKDRKASFRNQS